MPVWIPLTVEIERFKVDWVYVFLPDLLPSWGRLVAEFLEFDGILNGLVDSLLPP
jgi:hypothetical protein